MINSIIQQASTATNNVLLGDDVTDQRICPFCGGAIIEIHCVAYCTQCHATVDSCCEGIQPNPRKLSRIDRVPEGESSITREPRPAPSSPQTQPLD
jgi:hypothetical protein